MPASLSEMKAQLRKKCRKLRKELGEDARARDSGFICEYLENWTIFHQSVCILTYMPLKGEVDLTSLLTRHPEKNWALPRIIPEEDHRMVFHPWHADRLVIHPFGMAEPAADLPVIPPGQIQLALVPGLAFDRRGGRLGYGGGYFDRFLRDFSGVSVGITFHTLLQESLPYEQFDVAVQWIVTEKGIIGTSHAGNL